MMFAHKNEDMKYGYTLPIFSEFSNLSEFLLAVEVRIHPALIKLAILKGNSS